MAKTTSPTTNGTTNDAAHLQRPEFIYRPLHEIKKYQKNPRQITRKQLKVLVDSITTNPDYFAARPIILSDRTGELIIIAGNQRYEAAREAGLETVPTILLKNLTEEKEKEIVIRDNVSNGEWDFDMLMDDWTPIENLAEWGIENMPEFDNIETLAGDLTEERLLNRQEKLQRYQDATVKTVTLAFEQDEYDDVINDLDLIMESMQGAAKTYSDVIAAVVKKFAQTIRNSHA